MFAPVLPSCILLYIWFLLISCLRIIFRTTTAKLINSSVHGYYTLCSDKIKTNDERQNLVISSMYRWQEHFSVYDSFCETERMNRPLTRTTCKVACASGDRIFKIKHLQMYPTSQVKRYVLSDMSQQGSECERGFPRSTLRLQYHDTVRHHVLEQKDRRSFKSLIIGDERMEKILTASKRVSTVLAKGCGDGI